MKKIFVIRKYVLAKNAKEAMKLDFKTPIDDCYAHDDTHREFLLDMQKNEIEGFRGKNNKTKIKVVK